MAQTSIKPQTFKSTFQQLDHKPTDNAICTNPNEISRISIFCVCLLPYLSRHLLSAQNNLWEYSGSIWWHGFFTSYNLNLVNLYKHFWQQQSSNNILEVCIFLLYFLRLHKIKSFLQYRPLIQNMSGLFLHMERMYFPKKAWLGKLNWEFIYTLYSISTLCVECSSFRITLKPPSSQGLHTNNIPEVL